MGLCNNYYRPYHWMRIAFNQQCFVDVALVCNSGNRISSTLFPCQEKENKTLAKTTVDNYISGIWATIGIFFAILMIICFIFGMNNYNAWGTMFLMTLPCCGFGATSTGIILKEKSLIIGGMTSMIIGALFIICYICQINIFGYDTFAFALSFAVMMIIPGHIINKKAKAKC